MNRICDMRFFSYNKMWVCHLIGYCASYINVLFNETMLPAELTLTA